MMEFQLLLAGHKEEAEESCMWTEREIDAVDVAPRERERERERETYICREKERERERKRENTTFLTGTERCRNVPLFVLLLSYNNKKFSDLCTFSMFWTKRCWSHAEIGNRYANALRYVCGLGFATYYNNKTSPLLRFDLTKPKKIIRIMTNF
jgi:hypothetical protein